MGVEANRVHLVSFVTEGPPFDNGINFRQQHDLILEHLSSHFDSIKIYTPRVIKDLPDGHTVCNEYAEWIYPPYNVGAEKMGYWDWKPFVIRDMLSNLPDGDIVMYHDSNFDKYGYWDAMDWPNSKELLRSLVRQNNIFISQETHDLFVKGHVKRYTMKKILGDDKRVKDIGECQLLAASKIVFRNGEFTRKFVGRWNNYCQDKSLILMEPNDNPHPEFRWGCADQSILNVLIYESILNRELTVDATDRFYHSRVWKDSHLINRRNRIHDSYSM
jgi:hypothetical protein